MLYRPFAPVEKRQLANFTFPAMLSIGKGVRNEEVSTEHNDEIREIRPEPAACYNDRLDPFRL